MKLILLLVLMLGSLGHAAFVPPTDGPVPFRRDKLPVDVDTMVGLSRQLVVLVGVNDFKNPTELRRAAQILGVAVELDPTNRRCHELARQLKNGRPVRSADAKELAQARSRVWHLMGWLEQPEAGADGNALAACLADILVGVDPDHPRAIEMAGKADQGKWGGWVAAVAAFKDPEPVVAASDMTPESESNKRPSRSLKLGAASVAIPLWYTDKVTKEWVLRPVEVKMEARIADGDGELRVKLPGRGQGEMEAKVSGSLRDFLANRYDGLPRGIQYRFSIAGDIPYSEKRNGKVLFGAILVLADSAVSGKAPEGMVFAEPGSDGSLKLPAKFWQTIRVLADLEPGSRLVLPSSAKDFMPALITLDKAEFFFNFEVLLADDAAGLCELASSSPPEKVVEAHAVFEGIRKARGSRSLGGFLSHSSTQQRLKQVIGLYPGHVSARMLALRGTSQWPKRLSREIFAREIRAVLEPFASDFRPGGWSNLKGEELEQKVDTGREQLDEVESLFGSVGDRQELHAPALNVNKLLGGLADDAKRSSDKDGTRLEHEAAYREAWADYIGVVRTLTFAAGDVDDYPIPEMDPGE